MNFNAPWIPHKRTFLPESRLHAYLAKNQILFINKFSNTFKLDDILRAITFEIAKEHMYDELNPRILIFSAEWEDILNIKYCHCFDFRKYLEKEFYPDNTTRWKKTSDPSPSFTYKTPEWSLGGDRYKEIYNSVPENFDTDASYKLTPGMYEVLKEFLPENTLEFLYKDICQGMTNYIKKYKDEIIYPKNISIALIKGTLLENVFGVKVFDRSQVSTLLRAQCIPI